ncbi:hypothetical protein [Streptomyces longispororuber]|uniref:hypothetical protein n=1 Tax=Streptomyces longispororuber TaxID=68230 RepID=UPI00210D7BCC|nr:hypothetical protein [Streptomyces longispororuber]MCQ4207511.1 hypothetical protein [Streptomyces longispororuber]
MRIGAGQVVAGLVALLAVAGCGSEVPEGLVLKESKGAGAPASPYAGPLKAKTPSWVGEDSPLEGGGAALLTLECQGKPSSAGSGSDYDDDPTDSPEEALAAQVGDQFWHDMPDRDYRVERRTGTRVLFSYDVGGRTRAAVIVAKGRADKAGWRGETRASCDPSEFRRADRERLDIKVWEDRRGRPVSTTKIDSSMGPEHCDWQTVEFLHLDSAKDRRGQGRQYLRDPEGQLTGLKTLRSSYAEDVPMPADAVDTGYRHHGRELWLAADGAAAYVRTDGRVERWPGVTEPVACA